ncbi:MAG: hypothetical protein GVY19_06245 [Bacteroidetes bacterium]|nr:hypothetical protein [Bacteroidota bacterium]
MTSGLKPPEIPDYFRFYDPGFDFLFSPKRPGDGATISLADTMESKAGISYKTAA